MTPSWLSLETIVGLVGAVGFAALCLVNMRTAVLVFTALGCITGLQIGAFSGQTETQSLLPVEVLATVMIGVWALRRAYGTPLRPASFQTPLALLIPCAVVSMAVGFTWFDPTIPQAHVNPMVSLGQILLFVWPIGTYLVVANTVDDAATIRAGSPGRRGAY